MELKIKPSKYLEELSEELQDMVIACILDDKNHTDGYYVVYCNWVNEIWIKTEHSKFMII
jgi:hypothetical protein